MPFRKYTGILREIILPATLNSYSIIFFFNNFLLAGFIMVVTFFNFFAGLSGLIAILVTVLTAYSMGFDKFKIKSGIYSFNGLLVGLGMGTFFDPGWLFFSLLILASFISLMLSVTLGGWLLKYNLPFLSIPFIITLWIILLPSSQFGDLGITQRSSYWINELYAAGGKPMLSLFQSIDSLPLNKLVETYLRSMSSIFFQDNLIAGVIIALALLICSRIAFSLSLIGFLSAYLFTQFAGSPSLSVTYYDLGANYIMVAIAIGGFFLIPSKYSYLWSVLLIPIITLILLFIRKLLGFINLPVFSLPFSLVVILFIYFLLLRINPTKIILTPIQYYSPEVNLYTFINNQAKRANFLYFPLHLPFWGEWVIMQGYDGEHTHKGGWGKAYDFALVDAESKTYTSGGLNCEDFYCYNKPVLAPADGIVEELFDNIEDNEIGQVNTSNNWGNSIIMRHSTGFYTQLSHLKKGTFKISKGDFVRQGDILANCGNSGRSPEPHLHFQVQLTPQLGSRTIEYPFAYFNVREDDGLRLCQFSNPGEGALVSGIATNQLLTSAFNIIPSAILRYRFENKNGIESLEQWEAFTDEYNNKYLYCKETGSSAFYVNDGSMFYFTAFYGDRESLLYYFYLTAYKVFLGNPGRENMRNAMPLNAIRNKKTSIWIHDFFAPFFTYIRVWHSIEPDSPGDSLNSESLRLQSEIKISAFGKTTIEATGSLEIKQNGIMTFTYETRKIKIKGIWLNS